MPGLTAPSDYSREPPRHPSLIINSKAKLFFLFSIEPFNAEPPRSALISSYVTPVDFFYKRNHGPIPLVDDIHRYYVSIRGLIENPKDLFMKDVRMLPKYNVTATLQCAGNRRTAMSKTRTVRGVGWDISALGNGLFLISIFCSRITSSKADELSSAKPIPLFSEFLSAIWGGVKLADVLELVGIPKYTSVTKSGGKHVEFVSIDKCKEEKGGPYKASIPLSQATNPDADVLLAYEMNGEVLVLSNGWMPINIIAEECQGFFMQKDYKMFPPSVNWDNINWDSRRPLMDFPVQCAICSLEDVDMIKPGKVKISGYAVSGGGRGIERVDVSVDGGKNWLEASKYQQTGMQYIADGMNSDKWAWVLFEVIVDVLLNTQIVAKAADSAANVQPENVETIWNLRGVLNTSWHRVHVRVGHSNM
ncbi:hypothetical protein Patl1_03022 [Pistacia atlantica]|uniref:Uncharacterized protein n=1 Tax=Pistacia atlantica TaxID=434234 RepID=A0ACC1C7G2_9ROSI|nr:hypothetical protein Patl1_03022 [Pistacia atlantica]